jgi:hypothetical protein
MVKPLARSFPRGFALPEMLVAATVTLLLTGALLSILAPGNMAFRAQPALTDMQQRLRFAADVLAARLVTAGSAPTGGVAARALGLHTACLLPYRFGHRRPDPPGTWSESTITVITGKPGAAVAYLRVPLEVGESLAQLDASRCPPSSAACGITADTNLLLLPGGGQADLHRVEAAAPPVLTLSRASGTAPRSYAAGTPVVPVDIDVFYLRDGEDGLQLMRYDGWESDLPLLDHVSRFRVAWLGAAEPPRFREAAEAAVTGVTYGPVPPAAAVDLPDDSWGPGENCVFSRAAGDVVPRLPILGSSPLSLVALEGAALTDGPWCAHAAEAGRFDADLFRVRRVRLSLAVEAAAASSRGQDPRWFGRPGTGRNPYITVPDLQLTLDIAPRSLGGW